MIFQLIGATSTSAQPAGSDTKRADPASESVIVSDVPQQRRRLYSLLQRFFGNAKREKLAHTQAEVWTIPKTHMGRFRQRLKLWGVKIVHLREGWNQVLKRHRKPISRAQEEVLARARQSPATVGTGVMRASEAAVTEYALIGSGNTPGMASGTTLDDGMSRIVIPISDGKEITVVRTKARQTEKGVTWRGTVEETGESAVLMWWRDGRLSGVLSYKGHIYTVMNMGGDVHAVIEVDPKMMPPDHANRGDNARRADQTRGGQEAASAPSPPPNVEPISTANLQALNAKKIVIDVMMLYTDRAASHYMLQPADAIELAIEQANESFRNSALGNISLRLVHTQAVDYDEKGADQFTHLYRMVDGEGPFKDLRHLRNDERADLVGLIVDDPTGCGLSTRVASDAEEAYFIVHHSCAAITISIAHEVGHILGARHDRRIDPNDAPFAYGHGYVNTKWRDIMSYQEGCNGCPRIPFWSNPRVLYKGEPTGTLTEDNARVILEQAERVSNFR
jgi:hypothetical protein